MTRDSRAVAQWRAVQMMTRHLNAALERRLQDDADISLPEFEILGALADAPESRLRVKELAVMLSWERSRISHQVARMVGRELVQREACDDDLRGSWIGIADKGAEALALAGPAYEDEVRVRFATPLDAEARDTLSQSAFTLLDVTNGAECEGAVDDLRRAIDDVPMAGA